MEMFIKVISFVLSLFLSLFSGFGTSAEIITASKENCLFNVSLISDTHVDVVDPIKPMMMKKGLSLMAEGDSVNAVLVAGDLTNFGDEKSLKQYFGFMEKYLDMPYISAPGNHDIGHAGDRDRTTETREELRDQFIEYRNRYNNIDSDKIYYSTQVNGYTFIILGDQVVDGGHWDAVSMTEEQIDFLDEELNKASLNGKPVFVCSHWPIDGINGEDRIWDGCGISQSEYDIVSVMEKYENVFYISGHMHAGLRSSDMADNMNVYTAEKVNGVTYINLPTYGLVNTYGYFFPGTGTQLEVYENEVVLRPVNYLTGVFYDSFGVTIELD